MKTIIELINEKLTAAFEEAGIPAEFAKATVSNRPDLCEYQCNGAMAAAKTLHTAPLGIAEKAVAALSEDETFAEAAAVRPGFINLKLSPEALAAYLNLIAADDKLGVSGMGKGKTAIIDYGGANVAKPLHIGHLRSAIIGESIKRMYGFNGYDVIGDVHLGDWGLQMGLIIEATRDAQPDLPYFDENYTGEYPEEAPFTISDLERIYPAASARSKVDPDFAARAHAATLKLQQKDPGYYALFKQIMRVSLPDLKKNYDRLNVHFELWKGESDVQEYIPDMIQSFKDQGLLYESEGAMVIDVAEPTDTKELPPCLILKSDGAALYATTDLATLLEREQLYAPDEMVYLTDKRQDMHFKQVFRVAKKAGIVPEDVKLQFLGFGTMNGEDGKPFKTRSGGVMRLESLIEEIYDAVYQRIQGNEELSEEEAKQEAEVISLAALKYGDLSNQASKDYVFNVEKFISFEGNTGPYILYCIVRIKSILRKYAESAADGDAAFDAASVVPAAGSAAEKALQLALARVNEVLEGACRDLAPHRLCQYIYEIANAFSSFYHETRILAEPDEEKRAGYIALLKLTLKVLLTCIDLLGFEAADRM
ncbi:MAG: arginine--tRNA ligase [Lachnospiraceae bacterium]|nr:arginine--tRNA ligase [Lachnospiraceae bacterium]